MNPAYRTAARALLLTSSIVVSATFAACAAAHGGPAIGSGDAPPEMSGTISGIVRAAGTNSPLNARKITAVDVASGTTYTATTATNGGYTMKVPMGRYRLTVELAAGETLRESPDEVVINRSDLDSGRDFLVAVKPG
jgi:hypothetical protein